MNGKLVRDKIPDIMKKEGQDPEFHVLDTLDFKRALVEKLKEEVAEFLDTVKSDGFTGSERQLEELCDIQEVIYAFEGLLPRNGILEETCEDKYESKGGFKMRYFLVNKEGQNE